MTEIRRLDGIRDAIARSPEGEQLFVENFIAIATVTTAEGFSEVFVLSDVAMQWQTLGMLHHALLVAEDLHDEDEDPQ